MADPDSIRFPAQRPLFPAPSSSHRGEDPPIKIPDHDLIRRIGLGSYGEVWLARNVMGTYRAIKIIVLSRDSESDRFLEREFVGIQRFEPISRSFEGFIDILQVGRDLKRGYFYYIMELGDDLVAGQNINPETYAPRTLHTERCARGRLPLNQCLQIGLSLSQALSHLHQHELVHRDIKPSNIIFVNGVPKLADIGLVAGVKEAKSYVGTEGFIPPEGPGTPQADVFGLGKVLYEISSGMDRNDFPDLPTDWEGYPLEPERAELNEVIVKACQREVAKRYATARDMHSELVILENGQSVKRLRFLEKQFSRLAWAGSVVGIALLVGAAIYLPLNQAHKRKAETKQRQVGQSVANTTAAMKDGDYFDGLGWTLQALELDQNSTGEASHRFRFGALLGQCPKLVQMWSRPSSVNWAEFSPDGHRIAMGDRSGMIQIVDAATGEVVFDPPKLSESVESVSFRPDGIQLVTAGPLKDACIWDLPGNKVILKLHHPARVNTARFSPDGRYVVTACEDRNTRLWNAGTGEQIGLFQPHQDEVRYANFDSTGTLVVTASQDGTARVHDVATRKPYGPPFRHMDWVFHAEFSPDAHFVVTACNDRKARIWSVGTDREAVLVLPHTAPVLDSRFSPDGHYVVTGGYDFGVRVWDARSGQLAFTVLNHSGRIDSASFSPEGRRIAVACWDGTVRLWDLAGVGVPSSLLANAVSQDGSHFLLVTNECVQLGLTAAPDTLTTRLVLPHKIEAALLSRKGDYAVTSIENTEASHPPKSEIAVWATSSGLQIGLPMICDGPTTNLALSDDAKWLVAVHPHDLQIFDVMSGRIASLVQSVTNTLRTAVFSPDGSRLLVLCSDNTVHVRTTSNGQLAYAPLVHDKSVSYAEFNLDGKAFITCTSEGAWDDCSAQIWETATGTRIGSPLEHNDGVLFGTFSHNQRSALTASEDFTARIWDLSNRDQPPLVLEHQDQIYQAIFNADDRWVVTAGRDKMARVWDARNGEPITPFLRGRAPLMRAGLLPDGSGLLTEESRTSNFWIWKLAPETRGIEDLRGLVRIFSRPQRAYSQKSSLDHNPETLQSIWQRLRKKYPSQFVPSQNEICSWHANEVELCTASQDWPSALFHLNILLILKPGDPLFVQRRDQIQAKLQELQSDK